MGAGARRAKGGLLIAAVPVHLRFDTRFPQTYPVRTIT